ncbi:hypothetical protein [Candidatus Lokiarchaeum ossiferum]|uniref:hypothetical protein n=1 Tax=Candidatus Lokiarchaeum ossiferum TaxID=2951803 RepID=UPI00352FDCCB
MVKRGNKIFAFFLIFIFLLSATGLGYYYFIYETEPNTISKPKQYFGLGGWSYEFDENTSQEIISSCLAKNWTFLLISINTHELNQSHSQYSSQSETKALDLIKQAHEENISIHIMTLEDPVFCERAFHDNALQRISEILAFNTKYPRTPFDGIHLDVEPHGHPNWNSTASWTEKNLIFEHWLELLSKIRVLLDEYKADYDRVPVLSGAVAYWYNERTINNSLERGDPATLHTYLEVIIPMVYGGIGKTAEDIYAKIEDELPYSPMVIGIGYEEFSSHSAMLETIAALSLKCENSTNFFGISIYHASLIE